MSAGGLKYVWVAEHDRYLVLREEDSDLLGMIVLRENGAWTVERLWRATRVRAETLGSFDTLCEAKTLATEYWVQQEKDA